jgi:hypothetical protein
VEVRNAFRSDVEVISRTPDSPSRLITASVTSRIGVLSLLKSTLLEPVRIAGARLLDDGLPGTELPFVIESDTPSAWARTGDEMEFMKAPLLAMAAFDRAASGYLNADDLLSHLLARVRRATAWAAAGNSTAAGAALAEIALDARDAGMPEVIDHAEHELRAIEGASDPAPRRRDRAHPRRVGTRARSPFIFDPDTGKVIGGMLLAEAEHESQAADLLCRTWEIEFPDDEPPFARVLALIPFEETVPVLGRPGKTKRMKLAQLMRASRYPRFADDDLVAKANGEPRAYIEHLATSMFRALWIMHALLQGSFTSSTGSCLSPANVTACPLIVDLETASAPALGGDQASRDDQAADAVHAFVLVLIACDRLRQYDQQAELLAFGFDAYRTPWRGPRDAFVAEARRLTRTPLPSSNLAVARALADVLVPVQAK